MKGSLDDLRSSRKMLRWNFNIIVISSAILYWDGALQSIPDTREQRISRDKMSPRAPSGGLTR